MTYNSSRKITILNIIEYIFMLLTVLEFNSVYMYSPKFIILKELMSFSWQFILLILFVHSLLSRSNYRMTNLLPFIYIFILISLFFFIYDYFITSSIHVSYIIKLILDPVMLITFFYFQSDLNQLNKLFIKLFNVILVISFISLIFWIFFIIHIPTTSSTFITWGTKHMAPDYFSLDFLTQTNSTFIGLPWIRNSGLFVEPSMFSYVLIIGLLIELFIKTNNKIINYKIIILLLALISTTSTTGILVSIIAIVYHSLIVSNNSSYKTIFIIMLPILLLFFKLVFSSKTDVSNTDLGSSYNIRMDDINAGIKTWLQHPLLGCGLNNNSNIRLNMSPWRFINGTPGDSAGFTSVLAQEGIIGTLYYLLPTIIASRSSKRLLGLAIFSFIPFIFITIQSSYIYTMLLSYFWIVILKYYKRV